MRGRLSWKVLNMLRVLIRMIALLQVAESSDNFSQRALVPYFL